MSSVDNRVVQMQFDNKQFENGIKTSTKSLDDLKKGLDLESSAKSLSNLDKVGRSFSLEGVSQGVDNLRSKFSALEIIGITALANITNSAINAGKSIISSLTVAPVSEGYQDYMRKITSIQTITNATGKSIKDVGTYFSQLDTYADKTIYNLDDMTSALAKFTNAGVDMDKSVPAIKGIANMVALAGQDAGAAQIAFYNLSQSIAGGFLTTTDYKSLNLANVATKEWKDQMIAGAIAAGTLKKTSKGLYIIKGSKEAVTDAALFNEELSKGWASTKVMLDVFGKYGNEQTAIGKKALSAAQDIKSFGMMMETLKAQVGTGWTDTFEILIGNLEESKALFTPLTNTISGFLEATSNARNNMLAFWKANGGREAVIQGIVNVFQALQAILKPVHDAFREVFPPATGDTLVIISKAFRDFTEKLKIGAQSLSGIKVIFKALFTVLDIGLKSLQLLLIPIGMLLKLLAPVGDGLLWILGIVSKYLVALSDSIDTTYLMNNASKKMGEAFTMIKETVNELITVLGPKISSAIQTVRTVLLGLANSFMETFSGVTVYAAELNKSVDPVSHVATATNKLGDALERSHNFFVAIRDVIVKVAKAVGSVLGPIFDSIKKKFDELSMQDIGALLTGGGLLIFARTIAKGLGSVDNILSNFSEILERVGDTIKAFQLKIKAEALLKIAIALAVLAGALLVLSSIDMADLAKGLGALTVLFAELVVGLKMLDKSTKTMGILQKQSKLQLVSLGASILILAFAAKTLASIPAEGLVKATTAIAALLGIVAMFTNFTKEGDLKKSTSGLIGLAIGITIFAGAIAILGNMDTNKLIQGGVAIASLMTVIALFINLTKSGDLKASAGGLVGFSVGILILTGSLAILANLDYDKLKQGMTSLGALMVMIALFINLTKGGELAKSAAGLVGFATGIALLTASLAILGSMDTGKLMQGAIAISTLMTVIGVFINVTKEGDLKGSASGLIGFAIGLTVLTGALVILGNMDNDKLKQGAEAIAALMGSIAVFIALTKEGDLKGSAAGLIGFAAGLVVMSGAVAVLAGIDSNRIVQGVSALVAVITSIGLFVNLTKGGDLKKSAAGLIGFSSGLMILAGVIAILSALNTEKLLMASTAVSALMVSIALFVNLTKEGDLVKSSAGLMVFSVAIATLAGALLVVGQMDSSQIIAAGLAISAFLISIIAFTQLTNSGDVILAAVSLTAFSGAIMLMTGVLITLGGLDMATLVTGIAALAGILVVIGLTSIVLAPLIPTILALSSAIALFGAGCLAVGAGMLAFGMGLDTLSRTGVAGAQALTVAVTSIIALIPLALTTLAIGLLGFITILGNNAPIVAQAFIKIVTAICDAAVASIPKMVDSGMKLVLGILNGIANNIQSVVAAGINVIVQFLNGVASKLPAIINSAFTVIISFINGLADAIRNNNPAIFAAIGNLLGAIVGAIVGFIPNMVGVGARLIQGFINGIFNMGGSASGASKSVASNAVSGASGYNETFYSIGSYMMQGMVNGIKSMAGNLLNSARSVVSGAVSSVKSFLGIHSPSRVFAEIGMFSALGMANGLRDFGGTVVKEAKNVGINAVDTMGNAISNISDVVNSNMDTNPTIRPVLDLSDVQNGSKRLSSLMDKNGIYTLNSSVGLANVASSGMSYNKVSSIDSPSTNDVVQPINQTQQNTFNITGSNPKEIADEVSRILQKQVERSETVWA